MKDYLQLLDVDKSYGEKRAVSKLNLGVPNGCIYGIIGPNGAGKTTTIRMIMNIIIPDSGSILINGQLANEDSKNNIGYLPEERGLYKKMTLREIIMYLGSLKNHPPSQISSDMDFWLEKMNLIDYKNSKVEELSKGMQQKLQFITTLIHKPQLIILDELFSGLDPLNIELIKNILLELKKEGRTILFSTHVMEQAEKLCDYICMINKGQKVLDGSMGDVKSQYGKNNIHLEIDGDSSFLDNIPEIESITRFNKLFELTLKPEANTNELLRKISDKTIVNHFEKVEPSLYNIFISLAGGDALDDTGNNIMGGIGNE